MGQEDKSAVMAPSASQGPRPDGPQPAASKSADSTGTTNQRRGRGGGRGGSRHGGRGFGKSKWKSDRKRQEQKRSEYHRDQGSRRERNEATKRRRTDNGDNGVPIYATEFSKEEIENEERRPKRKVAVLIGYAGTGYHGLQLSHKEKTIEGDLFQAFVTAGAVSKANADDPKKTSLVRCARTDKGVHAAGNMLSLKLIIEDDDIVEKINSSLPPQIRVWGLTRVNGSFSCYQLCDSRIYEYLIPTHCFLPPHPKSYLGRKLTQLAEEAGDMEGYKKRQEEVADWWNEVEEKQIGPLLNSMEPELRDEALRITFEGGSRELKAEALRRKHDEEASSGQLENSAELLKEPNFTPLEQACRKLKSTYQIAKNSYRIHPLRIERIRDCLQRYVGTHNYHNYTIKKSFSDPSANRVIHSFVVAPEPIVINDTEWLSLKVHGQSFMMHQIRKMVSMCALVVRCGAPPSRIEDSFTNDRFNIPKAPGLGLLLERPVFDNYNKNLKNKGGVERDSLDFAKFNAEIDLFKQKEIYERIFREEEQDNLFHGLTSSLDALRSSELLYLSSIGYEATKSKEGDHLESIEDAEKLIESGDDIPGPEDS